MPGTPTGATGSHPSAGDAPSWAHGVRAFWRGEPSIEAWQRGARSPQGSGPGEIARKLDLDGARRARERRAVSQRLSGAPGAEPRCGRVPQTLDSEG